MTVPASYHEIPAVPSKARKQRPYPEIQIDVTKALTLIRGVRYAGREDEDVYRGKHLGKAGSIGVVYRGIHRAMLSGFVCNWAARQFRFGQEPKHFHAIQPAALSLYCQCVELGLRTRNSIECRNQATDRPGPNP